MSFDVDIQLGRGSFTREVRFRSDRPVTALVGPSGIGKSSVLLAVAGLLRPLAGHVRVAGEMLFDSAAGLDVRPRDRRLGLAFQDNRLFPHLSVAANLDYARAASPLAVAATARRLELTSLLDRWPRHLSGGEARRVALGRALLSDPAALLLDEPLTHLDARRKGAVLALLAEVSTRVPILYVTHDLAEAEALSATVVRLEPD